MLVVGAPGLSRRGCSRGQGNVPTINGLPQMRTPSVAWRMVALDQTRGQRGHAPPDGRDGPDRSAAGGYAGLSCGGIVQPGVSVLEPGKANPGVVGSLGSLSLAVDVAVSPDRQKVALAVAGNNAVQGPSVVEQPVQTVTASPPPSCGTMGAGVTTTQPPGQVVAVAYSRRACCSRRRASPPRSGARTPARRQLLASDSRADTGHYLFHVNAGGGLACASCHPEGGEDGRVWNFVCTGRAPDAVDPRRDQRARRRSTGTAASTTSRRLMDDVFSARMAGPAAERRSEDGAARDGSTRSRPCPPRPGLDAAAVARGKAIFTDPTVGCATCHTGSLLTNNVRVDVGTGQAFQVPSLRGVSWRAPFMHNGCAATLADRFASAACGGGDKHGATSTLTSAQIGDLTAYLQSL